MRKPISAIQPKMVYFKIKLVLFFGLRNVNILKKTVWEANKEFPSYIWTFTNLEPLSVNFCEFWFSIIFTGKMFLRAKVSLYHQWLNLGILLLILYQLLVWTVKRIGIYCYFNINRFFSVSLVLYKIVVFHSACIWYWVRAILRKSFSKLFDFGIAKSLPMYSHTRRHTQY